MASYPDEGNACVEARRSEIPTAVDYATYQINELEELVANFESRLSPILSLPTPAEKNPIARQGSPVQLADQIYQLGNRLEALRDSFSAIYHRIEV